MDQRLLDFLTQAPTFDLYQISCAIDRILDDPARIIAVRRRLHQGMKVQYFNGQQLVFANVAAMNPTKVHIQDLSTGKFLQVHYAAIFLDESTPNPLPQAEPAPAPRVDKNSFQVGDTVSFSDKHLRQRVGKVVRRNEKSVTVECDGEIWRVGWGILRKVIDV